MTIPTSQPDCFIHLHVRSGYSYFQSTIHIDALINRTKELKMSALAITDDGNMIGAVDCYFRASRKEIKGIVGATVTVMPDRISSLSNQYPSQLVLLCENLTGYRNLCYLLSANSVTREMLTGHNAGLIALSGVMYGEISSLCIQGKTEEATQAAAWLSEIFPQRFFIELHPAITAKQLDLNNQLRSIARQLSMPTVATAPCCYLHEEDRLALDVLRQIGKLPTLAEQSQTTGTDAFPFMSQEEIVSSFADDPDSLENSLKIADLCQLALDSPDWHLPEYPLPPGRSHDEVLRELAFKGLAKRFQGFDSEAMQPYLDRLEHELESIKQTGFAAWFLFIADIVDLARQSNISLGPGRSFYPASLVSHSLGISEIDPLRYGLIFERFMNTERKNFPDIFLDVARSKRKKLIRLISDRYGNERTGIMPLNQNLEGRRLIRFVGRALNSSEGNIALISRLIPQYRWQQWKVFSEYSQNEQLLSAAADPEIGNMLEVSKILEDLPCSPLPHPSEILVTHEPLINVLPVRNTGGISRIQLIHGDVHRMGLPSFTVYGLKDIDLIARISKDKGIDIRDIPLDDEKTFRLISSGNTKGISELSSSGMRKFLVMLRPSCLSDIAAALMLHRPPPIESGIVEKYISRKFGQRCVTNIEMQLQEVLGETYGVIIYQEQVIEIAHRLAGYSYLRADALRRILVRAEPERIEEERKMYLDRAQKNGIDPEFADEAFDAMVFSAQRTFTKSHVVALALFSYRVAWLKAHFPEEFKMKISKKLKEKTASYLA